MQRTTPTGTASISPLDPTVFASYETFVAARPPGADEDVHMLPAVVDHVIERCTRPGDLVLDPFAGFGTTLARGVALGRASVGVELLPERVEHIRRQVPAAQVVEGDALDLLGALEGVVEPGTVDLVLTSPPYMTANDHPDDPLTGYEEAGGDYDRYLQQLGDVAAHCARLLAPGGYLVWNVADIEHAGSTTRLIRDCVEVLTTYLTPVGITRIEWDRLPHDLVADALLALRR